MTCYGIPGVQSGKGIDAMFPVSKSEFEEFRKSLKEKICLFSSSAHYSEFLVELVKGLGEDQPATTLKEIKIAFDHMHSARVRIEKESANKAKKNKGKSLRMDTSKVSLKFQFLLTTFHINDLLLLGYL